MKFEDFLLKYNGQKNVGNTPENIGECTGIVNVYVQALGLPHIWGHAKDLFKNADENFYEKILNTPDAIPQVGDIVVWSAKFNGTFGHTGIATGTGDLNAFEAFEQNDPLGSNCHLKTYSYNFVDGWLRPKVTLDCDPNWRIERDNNWNLHLQDQETITNLNSTIQSKDQEIAKLTEEVSSLTSQLIDTKVALESSQKVAKQVPELDSKLSQALRDRGNCLDAQEQQNKTIAQLRLKANDYTTQPVSVLIAEIISRIFKR